MISIIVPVMNEAENIDSVIAEIVEASNSVPIREILYIDDGSNDGTFDLLHAQMRDCPLLRVIRHDRRLGQSAAFLTGAKAAKHELLAFMDGDGQNDPADIALLVAAYTKHALADPKIAVLGQRATRKDTLVRRMSSRLANGLRSAVLKDRTRDTGCSLKLIRRADYLAMPYFDHMHRFLPALLLRNGVALTHVDVSHRSRHGGRSKYGFWNRALVGATDLLGMAWLVRRKLPLDYAAREVFEGRQE
jgi:dolichol-phosphate mannosyltransferase